MTEPKAEGAEFLKRLGIILVAIGSVISTILGLNALGAGDYTSLAYAVIILVVALVLYGICVNLASVNSNIHSIYLLKYKESQRGKVDDLLHF